MNSGGAARPYRVREFVPSPELLLPTSEARQRHVLLLCSAVGVLLFLADVELIWSAAAVGSAIAVIVVVVVVVVVVAVVVGVVVAAAAVSQCIRDFLGHAICCANVGVVAGCCRNFQCSIQLGASVNVEELF